MRGGNDKEGPSAQVNIDSVAESQHEFVYTLPVCLREFEDFLKDLFKMERRRTTVLSEFKAGFVHFISCLYVLPVVPKELSLAAYPIESTAVVTAICCGIGSIVSGLISNMPVIIAPPTAVAIYLSVSLQSYNLDYKDGNQAVVVSGFLFLVLGYRPFTRLFGLLIPSSIQFSTAIGIGMLTALAGFTSIDLVKKGINTLVELGPLEPKIFIAMAGVVIIAVCLHYHIRYGFCLCLAFGSIVFWGYTDSWPKQIAAVPPVPAYVVFNRQFQPHTIYLIFDLLFLYAITLNGLAKAFSDLANINNKDGSVPRGRWLYIISGVVTIFSGFFGGPPILISPESGAGIKARAKTGLSAVFGGIFFCIAAFFTPLFRAVPAVGTAPLLIAIGAVLFLNTDRIDWHDYKEAFPAYMVLFLIPFTYSILSGVLFGLAMYSLIAVFTGDFWFNGKNLMHLYVPGIHDAIFGVSVEDGLGGARPSLAASVALEMSRQAQTCWQRLMDYFTMDESEDEEFISQPAMLVDSNRVFHGFMDGVRGAHVHRHSFPAPPHEQQQQYRQSFPAPPHEHQQQYRQSFPAPHKHQQQHRDSLSRPHQWGPPSPGSQANRDSPVAAAVRPLSGLRRSNVAQNDRCSSNSSIGSFVAEHSAGQQLHLQEDARGGGGGGEYSKLSLSAFHGEAVRESVGGGHSRGSEMEMPVRFSDVEADQPSTLKAPLL